ncbi:MULTISPECIES: EpsG family protein [unclassified Pseudomonas]|uniref:EpsG family protein n=1 Tax=unclassified Pseudomonas TaxID=196821 RepID=UPI0025805010|nr:MULTISPECIES: EpsG family protein [unclassified Pseudomonas]
MVYIVAFVATALMAMTDFFSKNRSVKAVVVLCFAVMCVMYGLLAGLRAPTVDPDYVNYLSWLGRLDNEPSLVMTEFKDPGFQLLYLCVSALGLGHLFFFTLIALLSLAFKAFYARQVFAGRFAMLVFFMIFARFYIVHDFIQIRVGLAIAVASSAMILCYDQRRFMAVALYLLALSFHAAVLAMLPFFLLFLIRQYSISRFLQIAILAGAFLFLWCLPLAVSHLSLFSRIAPYLSGDYHTTQISLFSIYFLVRFCFAMFLIGVVYSSLNDFERFLLLMSVVGLAFQIAFSWNDALGLRLAEVFGFFDMAMLCLLLRYLNFNSRLLFFLGMVMLAAVFYASSLKLVGPYAV